MESSQSTVRDNVKEGRIERLLPLLRAHGRCPTSFLCLNPDLTIYQAGGTEGFLAYGSTSQSNAILGEPVCPPSETSDLLRSFVGFSADEGSDVVSMPVTQEARPHYEESGFESLWVGSEAVVDLSSLSLEGPRYRNLRHGVGHAKRAGVTVDLLAGESLDRRTLAKEFQRISRDWLKSRKTGSLSFIVGKPFMPGYEACRHFVAKTERGLETFAVFYPIFPSHGAYLDLTRRRLDSPRGAMDLLLWKAFRRLSEEGFRRVYMGMVPRAPSEHSFDQRDKAMKAALRYLDAIYPMTTERFFKSKFGPTWEPRFILFHPKVNLRGILALFRLIWPGGVPSIVRHKLARLGAS
ncbi:MAG: phosphatidylglycerol lysyltransferase domain-containing protein [Thermoplasmata archaeon]